MITRIRFFELPDGRSVPGPFVASRPFPVPDTGCTVELRGFIDTLMLFDDGTHGITDLKTSEPKPEHVDFYGRQLMSYVFANEYAAPGKPQLLPITRLGLICFEPTKMVAYGDDAFAFLSRASCVEIPRDDADFIAFLKDVVEVLASPSPPLADPDCPWCPYRGSEAA